MIPIDAPSTLLLGIWADKGRAAAIGSLVSECGDTMPDVLALGGEPWTALVQALEVGQCMDVRNVAVLTNDAALVLALNPPFAPPAPDRTEHIDMAPFPWLKAEWRDVGVGGNAQHWQALCLLGGKWGGRFRVVLVEDLPKARELWQSQLKNQQ